jgi:hypothetical protein
MKITQNLNAYWEQLKSNSIGLFLKFEARTAKNEMNKYAFQ